MEKATKQLVTSREGIQSKIELWIQSETLIRDNAYQ